MNYCEQMFELSGSTAVITGGAGVIAGALAESLIRAGARVALWGHRRETLDPAVAKLAAATGAGERLAALQADTGSEEDCRRALTGTEERFGPPTILINGVGGNRGKSSFVDTDREQFEFVLKLNLVAGLLVPTQVTAAYWIEKRIRGCIINMTSMASYLPLSGVWAYDAAKAAVLNLTQAAAKEFAPQGIRVNAIAPGFFVGKQNKALLIKNEETGELTERGEAIIAHTPFGRFGRVEELAGALLFLASERASGFVTGVSLPVDGGYLVDNI
jgi:NAD(P)-dependent dehydrogenase (short-subunit alcohol dehydrogenase family)